MGRVVRGCQQEGAEVYALRAGLQGSETATVAVSAEWVR
jgi:hypothetical protein